MKKEKNTPLKARATIGNTASGFFQNKPCTLYTVCALLLLGILSAILVWNNKTLVWYGDGLAQWYPNFCKLKETISGIIDGSGYAFWSWDLGLGQDTTAYLSTFLFNPLCWICYFFDKSNMDICFTIVVLVELYLAGLTACVYLRHLKLDAWLCAVGALSYVFSIQMMRAMDQFIFLFPAVLFPLVILGIDFIYEKKTPLVLIVSAGIAALNYLYMTYMIVVIGVIYLLVKTVFLAKDKGAKHALLRLTAVAFYALLAMAIVSPLLIPSIYALLTNAKDSGSTLQILPTIPDWLTYPVSLFSSQVGTENTDHSYIGMLGLFALLLPLTIPRIKKRCVHATMAVICLIFGFVPPLRFLLNGGSYAAGRWYFMLVFFCIAATCLIIQNEDLKQKRYRDVVLAFAAMTIVMGFISTFFIGSTGSLEFFYAVANIALGLLCLWLLTNRQHAAKNVARISIAGLATLMLLYWAPTGIGRLNDFILVGKASETYEGSAYNPSTKLASNEFYRSSNPIVSDESSANQGIYYGIPTAELFTSYLDASLLAFNTSLSVDLSATHRCNYLGNDNRPGLDYLLGVKKTYLSADLDETTTDEFAKSKAIAGSYFKNTGNAYILQSEYEPSLGYVFQKSISKSDFETLSEVEKEQALLQSVVVTDEGSDANTATSDLTFESKTVTAKVTDDKGNEITDGKYEKDTKATKKLTISFENAYDECDIYLKLVNFHKTDYSATDEYKASNNGVEAAGFSLAKATLVNTVKSDTRELFTITAKYGNCEKLVRSFKHNQSLPPLGDYITYLGDYDDKTKKITLSLPNIGEFTWDSIEVVQVPKNALSKSMQTMQQNSLNVTDVENDQVSATIDSETGGTLFLSIIKNPGWKVFVDGEESETFRVDTAFTGCNVSAGKHDIELVYKPIYFDEALIVSAVGTGILAAILIVQLARRRTKAKTS